MAYQVEPMAILATVTYAHEDPSMPRQPRPKQPQLVQSIGERIARIRRECGVTQVEMARALGVSQGNISSYERGALRLPCDLLFLMARLLKTTADQLLGLDKQPDSAQGKGARLGPRLRRRLELLESLPKREQATISRLLAAFEAGVRRESRGSHAAAE